MSTFPLMSRGRQLVDDLHAHDGRHGKLAGPEAYHPVVQDENNNTHVEMSEYAAGLGSPRGKKIFDVFGILALTVAWLAFAAACAAISNSWSISWRLGLTRQFQIVGLSLSVMNLCFLKLAPNFSLLMEARFGHSYIQNYEAILRNSFLLPSTQDFWRASLLAIVLFPIALSFAYKEFHHGIGQHTMRNAGGSYYGLTAPAGLQHNLSYPLSFLANVTTPFIAATSNDPPIVDFPQAYGFNTVILSATSSAKLDAPFPEYLLSLQQGLRADEIYALTADVFATVTNYNSSVESHRDDVDFWNYYLNKMSQAPSQKQVRDLTAAFHKEELLDHRSILHARGNSSLNATLHRPDGDSIAQDDGSNDAFIASKLRTQNWFNHQLFGLLMNDLDVRNSSWAFMGFIPFPNASVSDEYIGEGFRKSAMLFHTRRERCTGTWKVTYNSIQLTHGVCDQPSVPDPNQDMFARAVLAIPDYYMSSLVECLAYFSDLRAQSAWLMPTFTTTLAGVYWSRAIVLDSFYAWSSRSKDITEEQKKELYYNVEDHVVSSWPTMNASPLLYLVLVVQPILTTIIFVAIILMYRTPIDDGFGLVALLAGVRRETLHLLNGASVSGKLRERVILDIVKRPYMVDQKQAEGVNEYILKKRNTHSR